MRDMMGMNDREADIAKVLFDSIESVTGLTAMRCKNAAEAVHTLANGISGGVGVLAKVLVKQDYKESDLRPAFTFAALLINRLTTEFVEKSTQCTYRLGLVADTFTDYERLTGQKPDDFLLKGLVEAVRDEKSVAEARAISDEKGLDAPNVLAFPRRLH